MALTPVILLPVLAIIVALVIIAALWAWWSSSPAEPPASRVDERSAVPPALSPPDAPFDLSPLGSSDPLPLDDDPFAALGPLSDAPPPPLAPTPEPTAVEVLRVLRDRTNGDLIVQMEGSRYRALNEFTDFEKQRRFVGTVNSLARLAGLDQPGARQTWQTASAPPRTAPPPPPPSDSGTSLLGGAFQRRRDDDGEEQPEELSVAAQIEQRLQKRLLSAPEFAHRSLHIHSTPDGGVRVEVDGLFYAGVSDVPDEQARSFIQDTIHLWEDEQ